MSWSAHWSFGYRYDAGVALASRLGLYTDRTLGTMIWRISGVLRVAHKLSAKCGTENHNEWFCVTAPSRHHSQHLDAFLLSRSAQAFRLHLHSLVK
ncbi:hypothetical protein IG631_05517 [Alternaria alternata]|nr:hypothetical protein IG631_05517 [Alternaria alternata]